MNTSTNKKQATKEGRLQQCSKTDCCLNALGPRYSQFKGIYMYIYGSYEKTAQQQQNRA